MWTVNSVNAILTLNRLSWKKVSKYRRRQAYFLFREVEVKSSSWLLSWFKPFSPLHPKTSGWPAFVYIELWQATTCVALSSAQAGKNIGVWVLYLSWTDYSHWHGTLPRGLWGKQPRPVKSRQAVMLTAKLWIMHFPGRPLHHMTRGIKVLCLQKGLV